MQNSHVEFRQSIKDSKPTHIGEDVSQTWQNLDYIVISTRQYPMSIVTQMAINYATKYAAYTSGDDYSLENRLFASMPIVIWTTEEGAVNRTLLWANGGITLAFDEETNQEELILMVDKTILEQIK